MRKVLFFGAGNAPETINSFKCVLLGCQTFLCLSPSARRHGRCPLSAGNGKVRYCPLRVPNPEYALGNGQPRTLAVRCEGCVYEEYRLTIPEAPLTALEREDEEGNAMPVKVASPHGYLNGWIYEEMSPRFVEHVRRESPRLAVVAAMAAQGYSQTEIATMLGKPTSTIHSRFLRLRELYKEFVDNDPVANM